MLRAGGGQFSDAVNSSSLPAISSDIPRVSSIIRPNRIAAGIPIIDSAPTTTDSPPIAFASIATAALEMTAPMSPTSANHPIMVPRSGVGNSSVAAALIATVPPLSHTLNQKYPVASHINGHAKCAGGPQKNHRCPAVMKMPKPTTVGTRPKRSAAHAPSGKPTNPNPPATIVIVLAAAADSPTTETAW